MAQTENGIGISYKLPDGTMVWARRDTWAELCEDIAVIFTPDGLTVLEQKLNQAWQAPAVVPLHAVPMPVEAVAAELGATVTVNPPTPTTFVTCPACGATKDRWVEGGVSKKTGKAYSGFYGCSTSRCPGR